MLYAEVLCSESKESLKRLIERLDRLCIRRGLKVTVDKNNVMVIGEGNPCWMVRNWKKFLSLRLYVGDRV